MDLLARDGLLAVTRNGVALNDRDFECDAATRQVSVAFGGATDLSVVFAFPGDYDRSGVVDGADFLAWQRQLGATGAAGVGADGNDNGAVDANDLVGWRNGFGQKMNLAMGSIVPEPATFGALMLAVVTLAATRRDALAAGLTPKPWASALRLIALGLVPR